MRKRKQIDERAAIDAVFDELHKGLYLTPEEVYAELGILHRHTFMQVLMYCEHIEETLGEITSDKQRFLASHTYQNALAYCVTQIYVLTLKLPLYSNVPYGHPLWQKLMKPNGLDLDVLWEIATHIIPEFKVFCKEYLASL